MKYSTLITTFLLLVLISCQEPDDLPPSSSNNTTQVATGLIKDNKIDINGTERDYDIFVPESYNNSPIVILLHGNGSSSDDLMGETDIKAPYKKWIQIATENNIILLIPNGVVGTNGNAGWNDCRADAIGNPDQDDTAFIQAVLTELKNTYSINTNRVYVNGTSNGGQMAIRLVQEIPEEITAIAVIAASMSGNSACIDSDIPVSVLFMNGTDDPILPFEGGDMASNRGNVLSTNESINYWITRNKTDISPTVTLLPDTNPDDNSTVEISLYQNGENNTEIALYKIQDGGHTEPSILERYSNIFKLIVGEQNGDIEMADEIWDFFKDKLK